IFTPDLGDRVWKTWTGKSNDGKKHLNSETTDSFLTPEFSPYRLRIVLGPDEDSVKAPYTAGKGLGKVVVAEAQFEIVIHDVQIRVQKDLNEAWEDKWKIRNALAIEKEPEVQDGTYALMGRLPNDKTDTKPAEKGRLRIPMACHWANGQLFDQGN